MKEYDFNVKKNFQTCFSKSHSDNKIGEFLLRTRCWVFFLLLSTFLCLFLFQFSGVVWTFFVHNNFFWFGYYVIIEKSTEHGIE